MSIKKDKTGIIHFRNEEINEKRKTRSQNT